MFAEALAELLGAPVEIGHVRSLSGGCISDVVVVSIENAHELNLLDQLVVKRNSASMEDNFRCEFEGLQALAETQTIRVPSPLHVGVVGGDAFLIMEYVQADVGRYHTQCFESFGKDLARLHRATSGQTIGWKRDNYLGAAKQKNPSCELWYEFFADQRIGFQTRWAIDQGIVDSQLKSDCERIQSRMQELLDGRQETTSLLHGDLWSGNYLFDAEGEAVLLDPAVYRGCREAEWGMIGLFGGCPIAFEEAYQCEWAMAEGWKRRSMIYRLYHQLNHLNLFGRSYLEGCKSTAREILRSA